jgi:hypothetical protein
MVFGLVSELISKARKRNQVANSKGGAVAFQIQGFKRPGCEQFQTPQLLDD